MRETGQNRDARRHSCADGAVAPSAATRHPLPPRHSPAADDSDPLAEHVWAGAPGGPECYRVEKMRWSGAHRDPDRSTLIYNDWITLAGIPDAAHDYVVGSRSARAWLIDRYQVKTDKASGIVNDVNDWGLERGETRYILDLVDLPPIVVPVLKGVLRPSGLPRGRGGEIGSPALLGRAGGSRGRCGAGPGCPPRDSAG